MCKCFDDLINKFVKCEICIDSIFVFKTNSYNKTDLKLYYAIHTVTIAIKSLCLRAVPCIQSSHCGQMGWDRYILRQDGCILWWDRYILQWDRYILRWDGCILRWDGYMI